MAKYPSQMQDKFNLRFPDGMRDAIAERAKANGRSMNSEIVQILEDALDEGKVKNLQIKLKEGEAIEIDTDDINSLVAGLKALVDYAVNKKPT
ncbi:MULTISPECIES: Arc family DNA-binding protein [Pectobacterium]|uniref:Arc family DNA-binding protein n=1 Tax=Pectobacterium TaxID=122277 RepID=UPI001FCABB3C|nr:Arc family DNA-binding protein [Pectobacterium odoriferum]